MEPNWEREREIGQRAAYSKLLKKRKISVPAKHKQHFLQYLNENDVNLYATKDTLKNSYEWYKRTEHWKRHIPNTDLSNDILKKNANSYYDKRAQYL